MRVRRGLLFWGLLLVPIGGIPLLVRADVVRVDQLSDVWRLWPLILIAIGLTIVLARGRAALIGTVLMALVLGSFAGAALAAGPVVIDAVTSCDIARNSTFDQLDRSGSFDLSARVALDLRCGSVEVRSRSDGTWHLTSTHRGGAPIVESTGSRLTVRAPSGNVREDWTVELPAARSLDRLELTANAATGAMRLDRLDVDEVAARMNAGDLIVDLGDGRLRRLEATLNAGRLRLTAGAGDLEGSVTVNAGGLDLCAPSEAGLRLSVVEQPTFFHNLASRALTRTADGAWVRPASGGAGTIALRIEGNAASLTLDPSGGCR